jgi:hypothetical protein
MKGLVALAIGAIAIATAVASAQQMQSRTAAEQKALAEALRTLPSAESSDVEGRLKNFKIDLDAVISQQLVLSPGQDFRIQREVEDRLKPVPIVNNGLQPVLPQTTFSLYRDLTQQESALLSARVRSVGRIETREGTSVVLQGTGFVAPGSVIATNCHVVAAIAESTGTEWRLKSDTRIDFADDAQHHAAAEYRITGIGSHSNLRGLDVAVLTVENSSVDRSQALPAPLPVSGNRFVQGNEPTLVGVVGYPDLPRATETLFRQLRDRTASTKLYSPGAVLSVETLSGVDVLLHVANTMKGNSGSPVLSRGDLSVVGVHNCCTAGAPSASAVLPCADVLINRPFRNGAISAWSVASDSTMAPFFSAADRR